MEKLHYKNKAGFSLVEMLGVLFIVSIIIIILSSISVNSYDKYQERLSLNEFVSDLYRVQTNSMNNDDDTTIILFTRDSEYVVHYDHKDHWKKLSKGGKFLLNNLSEKFSYRKGNLVSKASTIHVKFDNSKYKIIVHIDTGYITVDEV